MSLQDVVKNILDENPENRTKGKNALKNLIKENLVHFIDKVIQKASPKKYSLYQIQLIDESDLNSFKKNKLPLIEGNQFIGNTGFLDEIVNTSVKKIESDAIRERIAVDTMIDAKLFSFIWSQPLITDINTGYIKSLFEEHFENEIKQFNQFVKVNMISN